MKMPLMNDYVALLFLAESPWLFGFINRPANVWMARTMAKLSRCRGFFGSKTPTNYDGGLRCLDGRTMTNE
jgi:hypothetical protein